MSLWGFDIFYPLLQLSQIPKLDAKLAGHEFGVASEPFWRNVDSALNSQAFQAGRELLDFPSLNLTGSFPAFEGDFLHLLAPLPGRENVHKLARRIPCLCVLLNFESLDPANVTDHVHHEIA